MTTSALKRRLAPRHPTLSGIATDIRATVSLWRARARQRRALAELPPERLEDIGVSPRAARAESAKPFWMV